MGMILSRFRKKKTTIEILEDLDSKIKKIEQYGQDTEHKHKKIVGRLVIYSVVLYIMTALIFYFYFFPASLFDQIFYITPLLLFPILILLTKKMVSWYYKRKISHNQEKLTTMQHEKKKILDEVTETETYKKAKEILLKFAPDQLRMAPLSQATFKVSPVIGTPQPLPTLQQTTPAAGELRRRVLSVQKQPLNVQTGIPTNAGVIPIGVAPQTPQQSTPFHQGARITNPSAMGYRTPLPRPVLPRERTYLDRLVDYLVGDGPANRYALICRQCESHNGMALKEEFEYFGFRCCYCNYWNPARKQKPPAPKLELDITNIHSSLLSNTSDDSSPINVEPQKLGEIETSTSDTDSDIEVVERPVEMTDAAEHTAEECPKQIETATIEKDILKSEVLEGEESKPVEKMEVDESYS